MIKKLMATIKQHWIKITVSLLTGLLIGGGGMYIIEQRQVNFWRNKYIAESNKADSLRNQAEKLTKEHNILVEQNSKMKDDLGVTILSSIRSNFYDLKALKSENYNTQMYYNQEEYKSNLVPKSIGDKWEINIFSDQYKSELRRLMDSIYKAKQQEK